MFSMRRLSGPWGVLIAVALAFVMGGCGEPARERTAAELRVEAEDAARAAKAAREANDAGAAEEAAARALAAAEALDAHLKEGAPADEAAQAESKAAFAAWKEAHGHALWTREAADLERTKSGLKASAYRAARGPALKLLFKGLAAAARAGGSDPDAAKTSTEAEPDAAESEKSRALAQRARMAGNLAEWCGAACRKEDGSYDEARVAAALDGFAQAPPEQARLLMSLGLALSGQPQLALVELDDVDPAKLGTDEERSQLRFLRGVVMILNHHPQHAAECFENTGLTGAEMQAQAATGHFLLAYLAYEDRDWPNVDRHLASSMRVWPNNPVTVYLTGERFAADGRREEAEQSFLKAAKETQIQWLAETCAARARALRDGTDDGKAAVLDAEFLSRVGVGFLLHGNGEETAAQKSPWRDRLERAQAWGTYWMGQVGLKSNAEPVETEAQELKE